MTWAPSLPEPRAGLDSGRAGGAGGVGRSGLPGAVLLGGLAAGAVTAAAGLALPIAGGRWFWVAVLTLAATIALRGRKEAVLVGVALIPLIGAVRRITAGDSGYVEGDPLAVLPLLLLLPAVVVTPARPWSRDTLRFAALAAWLTLSAAVAGLHQAPTAVAYGALAAIVPLLVGLHVADGRYPTLPARMVTTVVGVAVAVCAYGAIQWFAPPSWDLAWLSTQLQRGQLISVGHAVAHQFRIFATGDSPASTAAFLGPALLAALVTLARGRSPRLRIGAAALAATIFVVLSLTAVRTVLFAVPLALVVVLAVDRRVPRAALPLLAVAVVAAALVLPTVFSPASGPGSRFDITQLGQDSSFRARAELLGQFGDAAAGSPTGTGPNLTTAASGTLSNLPHANLDNGYLSRTFETGVIGLVLFLVVVGAVLVPALRRLRAGLADRDETLMTAIVVYFLLVDTSAPTISSNLGVIFWVCVGFLARRTSHPGPGPGARMRARLGLPQADGALR